MDDGANWRRKKGLAGKPFQKGSDPRRWVGGSTPRAPPRHDPIRTRTKTGIAPQMRYLANKECLPEEDYQRMLAEKKKRKEEEENRRKAKKAAQLAASQYCASLTANPQPDTSQPPQTSESNPYQQAFVTHLKYNGTMAIRTPQQRKVSRETQILAEKMMRKEKEAKAKEAAQLAASQYFTSLTETPQAWAPHHKTFMRAFFESSNKKGTKARKKQQPLEIQLKEKQQLVKQQSTKLQRKKQQQNIVRKMRKILPKQKSVTQPGMDADQTQTLCILGATASASVQPTRTVFVPDPRSTTASAPTHPTKTVRYAVTHDSAPGALTSSDQFGGGAKTSARKGGGAEKRRSLPKTVAYAKAMTLLQFVRQAERKSTLLEKLKTSKRRSVNDKWTPDVDQSILDWDGQCSSLLPYPSISEQPSETDPDCMKLEVMVGGEDGDSGMDEYRPLGEDLSAGHIDSFIFKAETSQLLNSTDNSAFHPNFVCSQHEIFTNEQNQLAKQSAMSLFPCKICRDSFADIDGLKCHMVYYCNYLQIQ